MFFSRLLTRREMQTICAALAVGFVLCGLAARWGAGQLAVGDAVCADTLRLHIRADSDSLADQTAKLAVRDAILALMDAACTAKTQPEALRWAAQNRAALDLAARQVLAARGCRAEVQVRLVEMYFSASRYAGAALPAGRYTAVRIDLGTAGRTGKNWWCVLYPGLCRTACGGYALASENDLVCGGHIVRFAAVDAVRRLTASRADRVLLE